jgi:hypothetical protein
MGLKQGLSWLRTLESLDIALSKYESATDLSPVGGFNHWFGVQRIVSALRPLGLACVSLH